MLPYNLKLDARRPNPYPVPKKRAEELKKSSFKLSVRKTFPNMSRRIGPDEETVRRRVKSPTRARRKNDSGQLATGITGCQTSLAKVFHRGEAVDSHSVLKDLNFDFKSGRKRS